MITNMGYYLSICLIISFLSQSYQNRRYYHYENNENFRRFMLQKDEKGNTAYVDLKKSTITHKTESSDVCYYLYTRSNSNKPYKIYNGNYSDHKFISLFNSTKVNIFISHGWLGNKDSPINIVLKPVILEKYDVNLFIIDWRRLSNTNYLTAHSAVLTISEYIADFINYLQYNYKLSSEKFILIGHSLGAHVVGNAGAKIKGKVSHIIGLDPAAILYSLSNRDNRLDDTDAKFVQVIHTSGVASFISAIGHRDYYPNGGYIQPGCGFDFYGSCSHSRSYQYLAESIKRGPVFVSKYCTNFFSFCYDLCTAKNTSIMGELFVKNKELQGDFYLNTNSASPYGLGNL